jgi:hypothetical protein
MALAVLVCSPGVPRSIRRPLRQTKACSWPVLVSLNPATS